MENQLIKGEIYCKLSVLLKRYNALLNKDFPSDGANKLTEFIIKILTCIKKRFAQYSSTHVKFIGQLIASFERYYGYLEDAQINNVPWSIIPAIEKLLKQDT